MLIAAFIFTGLLTYTTVHASSGIKIYDYTTKKESTYKDKQVKVTYNGTSLGKAATPGILVEGIALLPYTDIFEYSNIDAECSYNKEKGSITISKYGTTIVMTIGSKKATVNGKSTTLPVAPMKIKYVAANKVKILVPSRFVSQTLGLGYTWYSDKNTVAIEKYTILLSYNGGERFEYEGIQGKVTIDGKGVNLGTMPSIITNNTAMLRAKKVFSDSTIGADYQYNKTEKTITFTKGSNVLVMTVGSTTAYLNKKAMIMDTPPIIVSNHETNTSYVMVPGGFTASCLGYNYSWNNSSRTSLITTQKEDSSGGNTNNSGTDPELGDSGVINETGTLLNTWTGNETTFGRCSEQHEISTDTMASGNIGNIFFVNRDYSNIKLNTETFMFVASTQFDRVTSNSSGNVITLQADNITCTDQTYQMYGVTSNLVNTIGTYSNDDGNGTTIELEVLPENYKYDLTLSSDRSTLYVTVYLNSITSATIGTNNNGDYLTLEGLNPLDVSITEASDFIYIDIPNTANSIGDVSTNIIGSKYIKQFFAISFAEKTQLILSMNEGYEHYLMENGNQCNILFQVPEVIEEPATPVDIDKSKYEILIPKPEVITSSLIFDEDFYNKNYFVIRMPGDYKEFYNTNKINHNSKVIDAISISLNSKGETEIKIATTKLQGYEIASDSEYIYVNIGNPKEIYKNIVVMDPGHGGSANGAQYFGTKEKVVNFQILYNLGKDIFNQDTSKLKVYYTRTSDTNPGLSERAAFVKLVDADLFVSLHMNASEASYVSGTEVFYSKGNNTPNSAGLTSSKFAKYFVDNLTKAMGTTDRGVKQEMYTVVHKNTVPAVLIELGFLSNKSDYAKLTDNTYQVIAAQTIYDTLLQVFKDYPTGR
jgi:N-acetylmuramoyl-L-alanine amidase